MITYRHLLTLAPATVQEETSSYLFLTERHLQVAWLEQKWMAALQTDAGDSIEVISPGVWNAEAGPDFRKAQLRMGQRTYRGDIEIHLCEEGWYQHGHHADERYNQVILHLVFWRSKQPKSAYTASGRKVATCYLENSLRVTPERLVSLIDLDLYPAKQFAGTGRCASPIFQAQPVQQTRTLFQSAAYWRLERKLSYLEQHFTTRPLQLAGGIAMALGYKHNALAFQELFLYLLPLRDLPFDELLAIALGCCGFLEEGRKAAWESSSHYGMLRNLWGGKKSETTHQAHLKLDRIRPLHHPVRRLAYLVHFLQDAEFEKLWQKLLHIWIEPRGQSSSDLRQLKEALLQFIPAYSDSYWDFHYTFESQPQTKRLAGLGPDVKMHILLNTLLPLLYGFLREKRDAIQWESFQRFYAFLKMPSSSKTLYLQHRFFGESKAFDLSEDAQMAQGAFQIHHDFCQHFEASCEGCPFVERYLT